MTRGQWVLFSLAVATGGISVYYSVCASLQWWQFSYEDRQIYEIGTVDFTGKTTSVLPLGNNPLPRAHAYVFYLNTSDLFAAESDVTLRAAGGYVQDWGPVNQTSKSRFQIAEDGIGVMYLKTWPEQQMPELEFKVTTPDPQLGMVKVMMKPWVCGCHYMFPVFKYGISVFSAFFTLLFSILWRESRSTSSTSIGSAVPPSDR